VNTLPPQIGRKLYVVEYLAVLHHRHLAIVRHKRLVAAADVDDGQASVSDGNAPCGLTVYAFVIRTSVNEFFRHASKRSVIQRRFRAVPVTKNSAHQLLSLPFSRASVHHMIFKSSQTLASRVYCKSSASR